MKFNFTNFLKDTVKGFTITKLLTLLEVAETLTNKKLLIVEKEEYEKTGGK